jgi:hypothetical protein
MAVDAMGGKWHQECFVCEVSLSGFWMKVELMSGMWEWLCQ